MPSVISFERYKSDQQTEALFATLLEKEVAVKSNVQPLSNSLLDRIRTLKAASDTARIKNE